MCFGEINPFLFGELGGYLGPFLGALRQNFVVGEMDGALNKKGGSGEF